VLFTPFQLGPYTLKNRLVALPLFTGYARPDGRVSPLLIEHYTQLAASGVAMVVVANVSVAPDGIVSSNNLRIDRDEFLPGLTRLASAIKARGSLACLQLNHAGRFAKADRPLIPPFPLEDFNIASHVLSLKDFMNFFPLERRFRLTQEFVRRLRAMWRQPMNAEDRKRVAASFGEAAARASRAGFDMVELHGATSYLLAQFLSPCTHKPEPELGPDFEGRVAFPLAVFREVRRMVPEGFPVGFRLLMREWVPGGIDLPEALAFAKRLEKEGVAYLSPNASTYNSMFLPQVRTATSRPAFLREETAALAREVDVPTVVSGRIIQPPLAESLLQDGVADLIGLARPLRVDIRWVEKALQGRKVRPCINCNSCLRRVILNQGFSCTRWPGWFRERTDLEHKLLSREMYKDLWVIADGEDIEMMKQAMPSMIPAKHGISLTILFFKKESIATRLDTAMDRMVPWGEEMWRKRGLPGGTLSYEVRQVRNDPDDILCQEVDRGGYGAIALRHDPRERWRERFLYRQRGKVVRLIGLNERRSRILIAVDLSDTTPLVMRYICHAFMGEPSFRMAFVHVLEEDERGATRRWKEICKVVGWDEDFPLRLVPTTGRVAEDLLREIQSGNYGTIIMGKRGHSGIKRWLLGSVSSAVLRGLTDQTMVFID
jgi:2,4-dienoyl-CoA reductase-like NADH-dependent reductase (Old Yellow Enzyme family)/nucleotide-binding universal stress UspA family protein